MKVLPTSSSNYYNKAMEGKSTEKDRVYYNERLRKYLVVEGCHSADGATLLCAEWDVKEGDLMDNHCLIYYGCESTDLWPTEIKT
jgi:hypothetical protein